MPAELDIQKIGGCERKIGFAEIKPPTSGFQVDTVMVIDGIVQKISRNFCSGFFPILFEFQLETSFSKG